MLCKCPGYRMMRLMLKHSSTAVLQINRSILKCKCFRRYVMSISLAHDDYSSHHMQILCKSVLYMC
jgi:hypothetical protein